MWPFKKKEAPLPAVCPREYPVAPRIDVYLPGGGLERFKAPPGEALIGNFTEWGLFIRRDALDGWVDDKDNPAVRLFAPGQFAFLRVYHDGEVPT